MQMLSTTKIIKVGDSMGIIIPVEILRAYQMQRGDHIVFVHNSFEYLSIKKIPDNMIQQIKEINI